MDWITHRGSGMPYQITSSTRVEVIESCGRRAHGIALAFEWRSHFGGRSVTYWRLK